jgi:LDH2 family malate/lactate/ureidoglycolate dehydrogenase
VATALEKVRQAEERGQPIPESWALDRDGNPTTDPKRALESGIILPFGGYKSFGLGMAHEILTSALAGGALFGGGAKGFFPYDAPMNVSQHFQAIDIAAFTPLEDFKRRVDEIIRRLKSSKLRPGSSAVTLPGWRGMQEIQRRKRDGVPLPYRVYADVREWAEENGVLAVAATAIVEQPAGT